MVRAGAFLQFGWMIQCAKMVGWSVRSVIEIMVGIGGINWVGHVVLHLVEFLSDLIVPVVLLSRHFFVVSVGFWCGMRYHHGGFVG